MEILITLSDMKNLKRMGQYAPDGIIFGSLFSTRFKYSKVKFERINAYCLENNIKRYINVDAFIYEHDKGDLYKYFEYLKEINLDGIYFSDLGIINVAKRLGMADKLIYDPDTLMTNSLDVAFYLKQGLGVVLARELSLKEVLNIIKNNPRKLDMQVFGHLKMSNSRRGFLTNYFKHLGQEINIKNKKTIRLIEENRNYTLPIIEDEYGTRIYTDYCFIMYREIAYLKDYIKRVIIDDNFIEGDIALEMIRDLRRINIDNSDYLYKTLAERYPYINLSSAYLYQKTTKKKEENE